MKREEIFHQVIPYESRLKIGRDIALTVVILAATLITAYRFTFNTEKPDAIYWFTILVYAIDIPYGFRQSVKRGLVVHDDRGSIARHYMKTWFALDVVCAIPFTFLFPGQVGSVLDLIAVAKVLKLVKILKVNRLFKDIQESLRVNPAVMRLITFFFWFITVVHFMACGWCLIGAAETGRPDWDKYIRALYWCVTTIATIGYGDYYPNHDSNLQIVYTIVVQIFGVSMYSYIIGNVASLIANLDVARAHYQKKMEEISDYLRTKKIPASLQTRVRDYYAYLWETRKNVYSVSPIDELPHSLSLEINLHINRSSIEKVSLFKNADEIFIREIVMLLSPMVFLPGDYIIRQGEYGDCMYFLSHGDVEVLVGTNRVAALGPGSPFGETALLQGEKRSASIRTLTYCDVYRLSKEHFDTLRARYPEFDSEVKRVMDERRRDNEEKAKKR